MRISPWRFISLFGFLAFGAATASGATFTVVSTNDNGPGTLRQAILDANTNAGLDTIAFNIAPAGYASIVLTSSLDIATGPVIIDGTTQPGFSGTPVVEITSESFLQGLQITAGYSVVRGLSFYGVLGDAIVLNGGGTNVIEGNVFGLRNGYTRSNFRAIVLLASSYNRIGGTNAAQRNVIAASANAAIDSFPGSSHNRIIGNYIGTDETGTIIERGNELGIVITLGTNNVIGGSTPAERNIISGSRQVNVRLWIGESNRIIGNYIGTDVTGRHAISNAFDFNSDGVVVVAQNFSNVGGDAPGEGNLISGNLGTGIFVENSNATYSNRVVGNWIGVDVTGTNALPNRSFGLYMHYVDGAVASRNVISGNRNDGVVFFTSSLSLSNYFQGNIVGLGADGVTPIPNLGHGIQVSGLRGTTIGGFNPGERNIISANIGSGIVLAQSPEPGLVAGNFIGLDATGTLRRGNGSSGILGVGTNNLIRANRIAWNAGLGIDIWPEALNTNQTNSSFLPFPTIASATNTGTNILVTGTLQAGTNLLLDIEFFLSDSCDPSGFGEGQRYLGTRSVVTDSNGTASFGATMPTAPGAIITATTVNPYGNTSEFSPCVLMDGATNVLRLYIQRTFTATVEWSSAALGYQLQSTTNLVPPVQWISRTNGIIDDGTVRRYVVSGEKPANIFFRLVKP